MNSQETKKAYIEALSNINGDKGKLNNQEIKYSFLRSPYVEIIGNGHYNFDVKFLGKNGNIEYENTLKSFEWCKSNKEYYDNWRIKIEHNNKINVIEYNCFNEKVRINICSKSLGDTIAWIPYIEEFQNKHNCILYVSTFWNSLFDYPNISFIDPNDEVDGLYDVFDIGWFYNSNKEPVLPNTIPLQQTATNILGLEFKEKRPKIKIQKSTKTSHNKYVTIATHSTAGLKYWTRSGWQGLVNYLKNLGYDIIDVSKEGTDLENVINIEDKSINNTINYIKNSEFFIGLSSGLSWLSWAIGKKVVMISNFTEETHEFQNNCIRITDRSVCNSCWNKREFKFDKEDWNWCPLFKGTDRQFECQKSITSEHVIDKIKNII